MSNATLHKYRSLKPVNDEPTTNKLLTILVEIPNAGQEGFWIRTNDAGYVCLFQHDSVPGRLVEYVQGSQDDSVTTLYELNPVFATLQSLKDCRNDLISEIGRVLLALPNTVTVHDEGRERQLFLRELGTAQLMDVLAHFASVDLATV